MSTLPEGTQGFISYYDTSRVVVGFLLTWNGKVITYILRQIKIHKRNYTIHDVEVAAYVFVLKLWHHDLCGVHVDVFPNQKILQYVFT